MALVVGNSPGDETDTPIQPEPRWVASYKHLPQFFVPRSHKLASPDDGMPPGFYTYWLTRGQNTLLALKQYDYDVNADRSFKYDNKGLAETKAIFNGVEVTPETAIKTMRIWREMLEKDGYDVNDPTIH